MTILFEEQANVDCEIRKKYHSENLKFSEVGENVKIPFYIKLSFIKTIDILQNQKLWKKSQKVQCNCTDIEH